MKVIVTGGSGLLGRAVVSKAKSKQWDVVGLAFSRSGPELRKLDITNVSEVESLLQQEKPDFVVHAAAERFPDKVEQEYEKTRELNIAASGNIARISKAVGAKVLYISTDYVFDGANPPYTVSDTPRPLNKYGITKLEGEQAVVEAHPGSLVLRVPVLYGPVERLNESAVTCLLPLVEDSGKDSSVSNYEKRYPAHVDCVSDVICQLLEKAKGDNSVSGIFQWSGLEQLTKYQMCVAMAEAFSLPHSHIKPDDAAPKGTTSAQRPYDSRMDNSRVLELGITAHVPFKEGVKRCLEKWVKS